eukprot:693423-Prorocentrum_lima.AAC.1
MTQARAEHDERLPKTPAIQAMSEAKFVYGNGPPIASKLESILRVDSLKILPKYVQQACTT